MTALDPVSDPLPTSLSMLSRLRDTGNTSGWEHFFKTYGGLMHSVAIRAGLLEEEARDVVQEALIDIARQMPGFRYDGKRGAFKGWLCVVVRRRIIDHWRALKRRPVLEITEPEVDDVWTEEWQRHTLAAALDRVRREAKPLQYQAFDLHVLKDQPAEKVASRLGIAKSAVYWAKYRVSRHLQRVLEEIEEG